MYLLQTAYRMIVLSPTGRKKSLNVVPRMKMIQGQNTMHVIGNSAAFSCRLTLASVCLLHNLKKIKGDVR